MYKRQDLLRRLIRQLVHPDDNKDPLKIYADNKESYFQVKDIPINVNKQTGLESKYVGDVDVYKRQVITNVMTLVCHNNVRSIIMNIFWLSFEWSQFEYIGYGYNCLLYTSKQRCEQYNKY